MVKFNGALYSYVHNLQGDIVGIVDNAGSLAAEYKYDAWGKPTLVRTLTTAYEALAELNPFRYRGYVYDDETNLYYTRSRYYAFKISRWISADIPEILTEEFENLTQYNLFTYCFNYPIGLCDDSGTWPWKNWITKLAIGVGAVILGAAIVAATAVTGGAAAFAGAAIAGLKTAAITGVVAAGTSATITAVGSAVSGDDTKTVIRKTVNAAADAFADGFMWGGISFGVSRAVGYISMKTQIFKRSVKYGKNNFMYGDKDLTLWRHGPNFRIDVSATRGLHYHLRTAMTGIGVHRTKWISTIIGATVGAINTIFK